VIAACALLALRTLLCAYRAFTQPISIDEAITYNRYIDAPWSALYRGFDANNHLLYSVAAKLAWLAGGMSPGVLRIPSCISGAFLMWAVYRLLGVCESPWLRWLAVLAIGIHPLLLDFSIAARGYSLSLALFFWGLWYFSRTPRELLAGLLFGLSIAANLSTAIAVIAVLGLAAAVRTRPGRSIARTAAVCGAVVLALAGYSLRKATTGSLYAGYSSFGDAARSYIWTSIRARPDNGGLFGNEAANTFILWVILPGLGLLFAWAALRHTRHRLLIAAPLASVLAAMLLHRLANIPYPPDRAGLYFVPMIGIAWALAANSFGGRPALALHMSLASLLLVQFVTQAQLSYFQFWTDSREQYDMALRVRDATATCHPATVRLQTDNFRGPALEYHRKLLGSAALQKVQSTDWPLEARGDLYVLHNVSPQELRKAGLTPIPSSGPASSLTLAIPNGSSKTCLL
jgi:hypothetical protein